MYSNTLERLLNYILIALVIALCIGGVISSCHDHVTCKRFEYQDKGMMSCYGSEYYKTCEPVKTWVCLERE